MAKRKRARRVNHVPTPSKKFKSSKSMKAMKEPVDYNQVLFLSSVIAFLAIVLLLVAFNSNHQFTGNVITGYQTADSFFDTSGGKIIQVFIGNPNANPEKISPFLQNNSFGLAGAIIVYIAIWLILLFSFSYIFANFLFTRRKWNWVSWPIGLGMAAIVANFGVITTIVEWMAAITAGLGAISVFASMAFAFVAFFLVNLFANIFRIRRAKRLASEAEAGGRFIAGGIKGLGRMSEAQREIGSGSGL